ncbi:hypothetical protein ACHAWF_009767 [Thalassiosira exigua]
MSKPAWIDIEPPQSPLPRYLHTPTSPLTLTTHHLSHLSHLSHLGPSRPEISSDIVRSSSFAMSGGRGRGRGGRGGRGGEYYKNKYGGGGRGRGGRGGRGGGGRVGGYVDRVESSAGSNGASQPATKSGGGDDGGSTPSQNQGFDPNVPRPGGNNGGAHSALVNLLRKLDGKQYPAYHDIESSTKGWFNDMEGYSLFIGRAQSDPYAKPTRCRVIVKSATAKFPPVSYKNKIRSVALGDYLNRVFFDCCKSMGADVGADEGGQGGKGWSGSKGGDIEIAKPNQHVIEQTAVRILPNGDVCAQFTVNLPARGRTIQGHRAVQIFDQTLPQMVQKTLVYTSLDAAAVTRHVLTVEDQEWVRSSLEIRGLVAFVPDGALLPRKSGADDAPMEDKKVDGEGQHDSTSKVVRFHSPDTLRVSFDLPNMGKTLAGIGFRKGITLIVGGGFHGKSTLLLALQLGVYNKIPGDGREFCVCAPNAVKIRAEDGRNVSQVNITPFINNLPFGKGTSSFSTPDASGSTSQATNIMEALEMGAKTLLIDEDTCATNFMIRDDKMMQLVHKSKEPITPFLYKIKTLAKQGISVILVVGSCGDYFDVGDTTIMMDCYSCHDVTAHAKQIAATRAANSGALVTSKANFGNVTPRCPVGAAFRPNGKVSVRSKRVISYGDAELDLSGLEQLVRKEQTNAIALALQRLSALAPGSKMTIFQVLTQLNALLDQGAGLDGLANGQFDGSLARPRIFELAGAINRLRSDGSFVQLTP